MKSQFFRISDGQVVDESEALENGMIRSGYGVRSLLRDGAARFADDAVHRYAAAKGVNDAQARYEIGLAAAWRLKP